MLLTQMGNGGPAGLAVDAYDVYFGDTGGMAIWRGSKSSGGGASVFADGQDHPQRMVVDGSSLFWTFGSSTPTTKGGVATAPLRGGPTTMLVEGWYSEGLGVDAENVYCAGYRPTYGGRILRVPKAGGAVVELAVGSNPRGVAVRSGWVFWTDQAAGTVNRTPTKGGVTEVIAAGEGPVDAIVADASCVYWITNRSPLTDRPAVRRAAR